MDLSSSALAIDLLSRPLIWRTFAPGTYVGGEYVPGAMTETAIHGTLQAVDKARVGRGGETIEADARLWTRTRLNWPDAEPMDTADQIIDGTTVYEVRGGSWREEAGFMYATLRRVVEQGRTVHNG